ncbi:Putative RNA methyltransferase [uncultured archaeon]|nr:Putative RNA methyltransferase [uncultured archaeon]
MKISIAIPDSSLIEEPTQLGKTQKISQIARACAIFRVNTIYLYRETEIVVRDRALLRITLRFLETPQYLRRSMYKKVDDLKFAGSLSPLKIPSHVQTADPHKIKQGDIRDGIVVYARNRKYVDVGLDKFIPYYGSEEEGKRIVVQFKEGFPNFSIKQISRDEVKQYWGYEVKETSSLHNLLSSWNSYIIFTSRKGKSIHKSQKHFEEISDSEVLLVFGSPKRGIHEILGKKLTNIPKSQVFNFFPEQATETVRLEEAILGTLAILNILSRN